MIEKRSLSFAIRTSVTATAVLAVCTTAAIGAEAPGTVLQRRYQLELGGTPTATVVK